MKSYRMDPAQIALKQFRELISGREILPGRTMLLERMEERFALLDASGMQHLGDLLGVLSSKTKIREFAQRTGLDSEYLVLLRREAGSYLPRPFPLSDLPGIPFEYIEILRSRKFKNTRDFFEKVQSEKQQADLSQGTGIPVYRLKELFSLCDLSRISGVGAVFARVLYEAGLRSVEEYAKSDSRSLLQRCRQILEKYGYKLGKLGEKDMQYGIHYARFVAETDKKTT